MTRHGIARRGATAIAAAAMFVALVAGCSAAAAAHTQAHRPDPNPIQVVNRTQTDPRVVDLTVSTPALAKTVHVAVLLPSGYGRHPRRHYPVIYFLHGGSAGPNTGAEYLEWLNASPLKQLTANLPVIAVMPQADTGGWYTNWFNGGAGGQPEWESFHVGQLVPFIDQNFRTKRDRSQRALVGLSMGGYGAMEYASRYPDLFGTAASFSGAVDIANPPQVAGPLASTIIGIMATGDGGTPDSPFGNFTANQVNWRGHDPADLIPNLRDTNLYLYTGNGQPGPLDTPATVSPFSTFIEQVVGEATDQFTALLAQAHVPAFVDNYGPGTHSWVYWSRDLRDALPRIMHDFAQPSSPPQSITYTTTDAAYGQWGWNVTMHRPAEEFSTITDAGRAGFELSGSGWATVVTPPLYRPRSRHVITVDNAGIHTVERVRADRRGRLVLAVLLGRGNPYPEYSAQAAAAGGTKVFTTTVRVSAALEHD